MSEYPKGTTLVDSTGALVSIKWREDADWMTTSVDQFVYDEIKRYLYAKVVRWRLVYDTLIEFGAGFEPITIAGYEKRRENSGPSREFMDNLKAELKRRLAED